MNSVPEKKIKDIAGNEDHIDVTINKENPPYFAKSVSQFAKLSLHTKQLTLTSSRDPRGRRSRS